MDSTGQCNTLRQTTSRGRSCMHSSERMDDRRKAIVWREWKKGSPMNLIARLLEKPPFTVFSYLLYHGGIQPRVRCRRSIALSIEGAKKSQEASQTITAYAQSPCISGVAGPTKTRMGYSESTFPTGLACRFYEARVKHIRIEIEHSTKENTWLSNASTKSD